MQDMQDLAMDGRRDFELFGRSRARTEPFERRPRLLDVVCRDLLGEVSGCELGVAHASVCSRLVQLRGRKRSLVAQSLDSREVLVGLIGCGLRARHRRFRLPLRVDRRGQVLPSHLPRSGIEQRSGEREESSQHQPRLDRVPLVEFDPREGSGDGGRHRVALANARATVVDDLQVERRSDGAGHIDVDWRRAKRQEHPRKQGDGQKSRDDSKWPFHRSPLSVASFEHRHEIEPVRLASHDEGAQQGRKQDDARRADVRRG